ncbi:MAG: AAA family ATPase [Candidatus Heimdallarchaeota archaeon]|nr:AAA family ATPase [Candidatus Heimdallarchaeota archaeon]
MIEEQIARIFPSEPDSRFYIPKFRFSFVTGTQIQDNLLKNQKFHYEIIYNKNNEKPDQKLSTPIDVPLNELAPLAKLIVKDPITIKSNSKLKLKIYTGTNFSILGWEPQNGYWFLIYSGENSFRHSQLPNAIIQFGGRFNCENDVMGLIIQYWRENREISTKSISDNYMRHLSDTMKPFDEYLFAEHEILFNEKYAQKIHYYFMNEYESYSEIIKNSESNGDTKIVIVEEPPRSFLRGNLHFTAINEKGTRLNSAKSLDYYEIDQGFGLEFYRKDIENWTERGFLRITPNAHQNKLRKEAVKKLQNPLSIHIQKLADILSRSEGYPSVPRVPVVPIKQMFSRENADSWRQCSAIDLACSTDDIALILGPPGTGKTEIICEIIRQVVRQNGRVLMTAPTHVAVDNVLERIAGEKGINAVRVGRRIEDITPELQDLMLGNMEIRLKEKISSLHSKIVNTTKSEKSSQIEIIQDNFFENLKKDDKITLKQSIVDQCNVVCGTLLGIANFEFSRSTEEYPFNILIVDECSKAALIDFLVPAVRARKWILIGDHRQLPPYINRNELKFFIDRYFQSEDIIQKKFIQNGKINLQGLTREQDGEIPFSDDVEEISWRLTRLFEENHNLDRSNRLQFLDEIVEKLNRKRKAVRYLLEMMEYALGSCFHYFWRRVDESRKAYLPVQYRMPEEIAKFLSRNVYQNQEFLTSDLVKNNGFIIPLRNKENFSQKSINKPITWISTSSLPNELRYEKPFKKIKGMHYNFYEIKIICEIIKNIRNSYPLQKRNGNRFNFKEINNENPFTIGVISFYSTQARKIWKELEKLDFLEKNQGRFKVIGKPIYVRVSIVDRFQGQEQDIIILSMTRSNPKWKIGFLSNLQRMNVAISRAKHNLVIVGDHKFFFQLKNSNENKFLLELAKYCNDKVIEYKHLKNNSDGKKGEDILLNKVETENE